MSVHQPQSLGTATVHAHALHGLPDALYHSAVRHDYAGGHDQLDGPGVIDGLLSRIEGEAPVSVAHVLGFGKSRRINVRHNCRFDQGEIHVSPRSGERSLRTTSEVGATLHFDIHTACGQHSYGNVVALWGTKSATNKGENDAKSADVSEYFEDLIVGRRRQDAERMERQPSIQHQNAPTGSAADAIPATISLAHVHEEAA